MASEAYYTSEHYNQQRRLLINGDPRALVCFCVDVSQSMEEYWIEEGGLKHSQEGGYFDGHHVSTFKHEDIRRGYEYYKKIDKLNDTLCTLLYDLKAEKDLCDKVAVSIVTYSRYASVKYDFLDCSGLNVESCRCKTEKSETAMGDGLRTALAQLDEMQNDLRNADNDYYTPILVFMTDGTPTDNPKEEFRIIRERVSKGELYIFPLGIGGSADMSRLRDLYPVGEVPSGFSSRYMMVRPDDYRVIFQEIKDHVRRKNMVMVSEGDSKQSSPVVEEDNVMNNQLGRDIFDILGEL